MIDEELEQLEAELRRLRPLHPSAALQRSIAQQLGAGARRATVLRFGWVALPIAAGVAVMAGLNFTWESKETVAAVRPLGTTPLAAERPAGQDRAFKPVSAQNILIDSQDEGTATLADGTVVRRTRESYVDTITWKDPRTNASLTWSVPREEVRVVAVSYE